MQRIRIKFSRGEEIKYISHLDLMRLWSRVFRRIKMPLAYSEGFTPHPKISIANPLPIGVTSEAELLDITLQKRISPHFLLRTISQHLPKGVDIMEAQEILLASSSLQSQIRHAEYHVKVKTILCLEDIQKAIRDLLNLETLPWQHMRDTGPRYYDIRSLIDHLWIVSGEKLTFVIGMRLRSDSQGAGRPEQVTAALGLTEYPDSIHRTKMLLA